jgi:hypothetical protein
MGYVEPMRKEMRSRDSPVYYGQDDLGIGLRFQFGIGFLLLHTVQTGLGSNAVESVHKSSDSDFDSSIFKTSHSDSDSSIFKTPTPIPS